MEPCYQSMEGKPRKSRSLEQEPDLSHLEGTCLPLSLSHTIRLAFIITRETHSGALVHPSREKEILPVCIVPPKYLILSPRPVVAKQSHRLHSTHSSIPIYTSLSLPPPFLTILVVHTLSHTFHALFASVRSLFGNDSVLCGEAV